MAKGMQLVEDAVNALRDELSYFLSPRCVDEVMRYPYTLRAALANWATRINAIHGRDGGAE